MNYTPFDQRKPDTQYEDLLRDILKNGKKKTPIHASLPENKDSGHQYCLELSGRMLSYDLSNGIPLIPLRQIGWKGCIGEVVAFINGAHTLEDLEKFGCPRIFWERWVTKEKCENFGLPEHELGPGSYGPILTAIPMPGGKTFDQVEAVVRQMKKAPHLRTHVLTTWYPPYALGDTEQDSPRKVMVAPCHGNWIQFNVFDNKEMEMVLVQRSADIHIGLPINLMEWVAFGFMVAHVTGLNFTKYVHMLPNPQIYDIQIPEIEKLLEEPPRRLPSLYLRPDREVSSVKDFRREDFVVEDYHPGAKMIGTALI
jgi:thymidylate synthase